MKPELEEILPGGLTDKEASHIADIFMELALAIEAYYYTQIRNHRKSLEVLEEPNFK